MNIPTIIATVVSVLALGLAVFIAFRTKQVFRARLRFNLGLTDVPKVDRVLSRVYQRACTSTVLYCSAPTGNSEVLFCVPYLVKNASRKPIRSVVLQLEYPTVHSLENKDIPAEIMVSETRSVSFKELDERREVFPLGDITQVRYSVPLVRPGEAIVIADLIRFSALEREQHIEGHGCKLDWVFPSTLRDVEQFFGGTVVDAYLRSEDCLPLYQRFKILWSSTKYDSDEPEGVAVLKAFWCGKFPKPGFYWTPCPWRKMQSIEYVEEVHPSFIQAGTRGPFRVLLEIPHESDRRLLKFGFPPWDYLGRNKDSLDVDALLNQAGFIKLHNPLKKHR